MTPCCDGDMYLGTVRGNKFVYPPYSHVMQSGLITPATIVIFRFPTYTQGFKCRNIGRFTEDATVKSH